LLTGALEPTINLSPLLVVTKLKPAGGAGRADTDGEAAAEEGFELEANKDDAIELAFEELPTTDELAAIELGGFMEEDC
jgi:hypothetical protein